jgi:hypothetical protein
MARGGIQIAETTPKVNHLLFVDDCILFCKDTVGDASYMKGFLDVYCKASGQMINNEKSSVFFGKGCSKLILNFI